MATSYVDPTPAGARPADLPNIEKIKMLVRQVRGKVSPIYLDYKVDPVPRWGWGKAPHSRLYEIVDTGRWRYEELIREFENLADKMARIGTDSPADPTQPHWGNGYFPGLNAISLYAFASLLNPRTYLEIGSGNSTKFIRRSIADNALATRIVSIDPDPRAEIDGICDEVIRQPLEDADLSIFQRLEPGDILLIDNSHRCFQNSDVTVCFLDIIPNLKPGVVVYIDDTYLPYDYPPDWGLRYYSEQYLLATMLLADAGRRYDILFPCAFVARDAKLARAAARLWALCGMGDAVPPGNGFWFQVKD